LPAKKEKNKSEKKNREKESDGGTQGLGFRI
jgi:hypothetical protein